eukprot:TRINITY_DN7321_c0_g2_i3.p1 TRINITY_DN7321_c0_g2~~TRINITY_DN7321_c0_g2_i3.p1  ORF type:complete len:661 (+),score=13.31 TRINITY_DN7321_c0_g2_i3:256-2238(+)
MMAAHQRLWRAVGLALLVCCVLPRASHAGTLNPGGVIKVPTRGPCSTSTISLTVSQQSDFAQRLQYPNTTTVVLYITGNITLTTMQTFNSSYSCTIVRPQPGLVDMPWLWLPNTLTPAVRIDTVTNMQWNGIAIGFPWIMGPSGMSACNVLPEFPSKWTCPVLHVYRGWAVTFSNGKVYGRTDVYRSGATEFSYMKLYVDWYDGMLFSYSTIRFALCGDPLSLIRSLNKVTNCDIRGSWTSVMMYAGAVGIIVANNYITDFQFSGVQCGMGDGNVADCMLNTVQDNYITAVSSVYPTPNGDGSGIYYDLHWYNPGNLDSCNYIVGGTHCHYLDFTTTGLTIEGSVCVRNHDGIKINTGHANKISSYLVVSPQWQSGIMSCQNWCDNNCNSWAGRGLGYRWYTGYVGRFDTPQWRANWPHLADLCNRTDWLGVACNPDPPVEFAKNWTGYCSQYLTYSPLGKQQSANFNYTGRCSGVPGLNHVEIIVVNGTNGRWNPYYINCDALPSVGQTNNITSISFNYNLQAFKFDNITGDDFGVSNLSDLIYQKYPNFMSCSRKRVGPQRQARAMSASLSAAESNFGKDTAPWWGSTYSIIDYSEDISQIDYHKKFGGLRRDAITPDLVQQMFEKDKAAQSKGKTPLIKGNGGKKKPPHKNRWWMRG